MLDRWVVPLAAVFDGTQFDARRNNNNIVPDVNRVAAHRYSLLRNIVQYQLYGVLVRVSGMLQVAQQLIIPLLALEFPLPGFKSLTDMLATSLRLDPAFRSAIRYWRHASSKLSKSEAERMRLKALCADRSSNFASRKGSPICRKSIRRMGACNGINMPCPRGSRLPVPRIA